jgi:hypothetical protein
MARRKEMKEIEIFLQGEGLSSMKLVKVAQDSKVGAIIEAAKATGVPAFSDDAPQTLFIENAEQGINVDALLKDVGIQHRGRVHVHRCHKIAATVNFNGVQKLHDFPPSFTIDHVRRWATGSSAFNLSEMDATEHALQICDSIVRPDEDTHIGSLTTHPRCAVCFDLVPKKRVEGH